MAAYIPPGWPTGVHPPGSEDFEATAIAWLLDVVPPDFRLHGVLRRHPAALAAMARHHTQACVEGARACCWAAPSELGAGGSPRPAARARRGGAAARDRPRAGRLPDGGAAAGQYRPGGRADRAGAAGR